MMKAVTSVFWQNCSIPMHAPENISFIGMNSHKSAVPKPNLVNAQIPISSLHVNFTNTVQIYYPQDWYLVAFRGTYNPNYTVQYSFVENF